MASKPKNQNNKLFILSILILSLSLFLLILSFKPIVPIFLDTPRSLPTDFSLSDHNQTESPRFQNPNPVWFDVVKNILGTRKIKVGLVNIDIKHKNSYHIAGKTESHHVKFDRVSKDLTWEEFFPEWIDEAEKWAPPKCPEIPLARPEEDFDVVVARVPCDDGWGEKKGIRDLFRLQVNLVVANLAAVATGSDRTVLVVFEGVCGAMPELFRCDDLVKRVGEYWIYKPDLMRLKQKVSMPVGSCQIAPPFPRPGREMSQLKVGKHEQREAYVTVLHSSEAYVCGAIALAQSIILSNSTRDLILLHDKSITQNSRIGLEAAGWKLRLIHRIRSPFSRKDSYNEWNYSKLRIWQVTDYDKLIFIDADLLLLKNIDHLFYYPQLSASPNDQTLFNSGVMLIEPSTCMFEDLMLKSFKFESYNGGDQGFLNEAFTWWHRWPKKVNFLKQFESKNRKIPDDLYSMHYLGLKPWMCYREYDCNWDMKERQIFASDAAHKKWWEVYDVMGKGLQEYCGLSPKMDYRIRKWRGIARKTGLADSHWDVEVKDPRKDNLII